MCNQFTPHIRVESQRDINSCVTFLGQVHLAKPIPLQIKPLPISYNLKAHFGYGHVVLTSV